MIFQSTEVITAYEYVCKDVDKAFRATPMLKENMTEMIYALTNTLT